MRRTLLAQRLLALFAAGWLVLDFPLLRLGLSDGLLFGLPRLPVLLFAVWTILIVIVAWLMERHREDGAGDGTRGG
jgi:hypothetical protein